MIKLVYKPVSILVGVTGVAATLEGAIFALVKTALDRGAAEGTRKLTGFWPGEDSKPEAEEEEA